MGDPPGTTDRMHRHKHRHEPTNKTQGPSAIAYRPSDESHHTSAHQRRIPPKSGYETTIRSHNCTVNRTVFSQPYHCCSLCNRPVDRPDCSSCLQAATLPPKERKREKKKKDSFTVSLSCRRPREPGTSLHPRRNQRPSTFNPNLIRPSSERPFFSPTAPHGEAALVDLARDKNSQSHLRPVVHRLASLPMLESRLVGNISWCVHRCDVRIDTSSTANDLEGCHLP